MLLRYSFLYIIFRVHSRPSQCMFAVCYVLVKKKCLLVPFRPLAHAARRATLWVAQLLGASKLSRISPKEVTAAAFCIAAGSAPQCDLLLLGSNTLLCLC